MKTTQKKYRLKVFHVPVFLLIAIFFTSACQEKQDFCSCLSEVELALITKKNWLELVSKECKEQLKVLNSKDSSMVSIIENRCPTFSSSANVAICDCFHEIVWEANKYIPEGVIGHHKTERGKSFITSCKEKMEELAQTNPSIHTYTTFKGTQCLIEYRDEINSFYHYVLNNGNLSDMLLATDVKETAENKMSEASETLFGYDLTSYPPEELRLLFLYPVSW